MILAEGAIAYEEIAHRMILLLERFGRGHAGERAEITLRYDSDLIRLQRIEFFGTPKFVASRVDVPSAGGAASTRAAPAKAFGTDDQHRRARVHFVSGGAAQGDNERVRRATAKRAEFSGENDNFSRERLASQRI
jgi:hypothetical protein